MGSRRLRVVVVAVAVGWGCGEWVSWPAEAEVPVGASVRVDLSTGERWIERNATTTTTTTSPVAVVESEVLEQRYRESVEVATRAEDPSYDESAGREEKMSAALRKLPASELERLCRSVGKRELEELSAAEMAAVWAARQAELADAMARTATTISAERVAALRRYLESRDDESRVVAELEELEFELGDIDDARDFHHVLDGLAVVSRLVEADLPSRARAAAAAAVGTAVKHDPDLQRAAAPVLPALLDALATRDLDLQKKALYAIGALVRGDLADRFLGPDRGLAALLDALRAALDRLPEAWPVADKATTLLADLAPAADPHLCSLLARALLAAPPPNRLDRFLAAATAYADACAPDAFGPTLADHLARRIAHLRADASLDPAYGHHLLALATALHDRLPAS